MIEIRTIDDARSLLDDPDLAREVASYLLYCRAEFLEFADEEELAEYDFGFQVVDEDDLPEVLLLGTPEEWAIIAIRTGDGERRLLRAVYPTAVLFALGDLAELLPFANSAP